MLHVLCKWQGNLMQLGNFYRSNECAMNDITDPESLEPATTYMLFFLKLIRCKGSLVSSGHMMCLVFRPFDHVMLNKVVLSKSIRLLPCALPALVRLNASHMSQHYGGNWRNQNWCWNLAYMPSRHGCHFFFHFFFFKKKKVVGWK